MNQRETLKEPVNLIIMKQNQYPKNHFEMNSYSHALAFQTTNLIKFLLNKIIFFCKNFCLV